MVGCVVVRSLYPAKTFLPVQIGHIVLHLLSTVAYHSCPFSHFHQTFLFDLAVICDGVKFPFFVGCHCLAMFGKTVAKSVSPTTGSRPEQYGQPFPCCRSFMIAFHSCPLSHRHQTFLSLREVTIRGIRSLFFVGCHSLANLGFIV